MNDTLKEVAFDAAALILTTSAVTIVGFLTVKLCNKVYGPIEVTIN